VGRRETQAAARTTGNLREVSQPDPRAQMAFRCTRQDLPEVGLPQAPAPTAEDGTPEAYAPRGLGHFLAPRSNPHPAAGNLREVVAGLSRRGMARTDLVG
jgi:hypothetical protein